MSSAVACVTEKRREDTGTSASPVPVTAGSSLTVAVLTRSLQLAIAFPSFSAKAVAPAASGKVKRSWSTPNVSGAWSSCVIR